MKPTPTPRKEEVPTVVLPGGKNLLIVAAILGLVLIAFAANNLWQTMPAPPVEDSTKLTGFAFVAIGPACTMPEDAHEKIVSASANKRYGITLDATSAVIGGLTFNGWDFGDSYIGHDPKIGFCIPSGMFKPGEEKSFFATATDSNGKVVEDEIKIIFR